MSNKERLIDPAEFATAPTIANIEAIRALIPQRYEMEQLSGILLEDMQQHLCVGYKDITREEFWVRGHMPSMPLMPGVIMLEAAAQLASYYAQKFDAMDTQMIAFGGVEEVRFREPVIPGDRLIIALKVVKARPRRMMICRFEGYVREKLVLDGTLKGVPMPVDALDEHLKKKQAAAS